MINRETLNQPFCAKTVEENLYEFWEECQVFSPSGQGHPFCIMIPPPNITGTLHMGHALECALIDALVRYQRMSHKKTLWQMGTDHASIATQLVVERQLAAIGESRHDLGRKAFLEKVWQWKEKSGGTISRQLRRMGASVDWTRERFTLDPELSAAVKHVFVTLYEENLIYRGRRLVNWDPVFHTAVSDLEVVTEEKSGHLWHIRYPLADQSGHVIIATTRPETMLGDVAVAVHPEDPRYQHLIGQKLQLPLTKRVIPIISDDYVDREFGTGCVKITPAHDFNDYEIGRRHKLPEINIFTESAALNENVPERFQGLDRFVARKKIIDELKAEGFLEKIEDHLLKLPTGDRSGAILEPFLTHQWFVKVKPLAEPAIRAVQQGQIRFIPKNWENTYFSWMNNIQDWCISRALWWGHQIPAWYDDAGHIYVATSEEEVRKKYKLKDDVALRQDPDVLDTWFSSALWPFSTLGWPHKTVDFSTFYPTQVLVTGFDIIFFWVARMIMMGLKFTEQAPFKDIYIHGLICDRNGQKMSKSKGNVLDPLDLIDGINLDDLIQKRTDNNLQPEKAKEIAKGTREEFPEGIEAHGTDALRFTLCALASQQRHIHFDMQRLAANRNFCNKLWNASRFVLMQAEQTKLHSQCPPNPIDVWVQQKLSETITLVDKALQEYRFDLAASALYEFIWHQFCDWYLELSKALSKTSRDSQIAANRFYLLKTLEATLRLLHPFMPYITEALWQQVKQPLCIETTSIAQTSMPQAGDLVQQPKIAKDIDWVVGIITALRTLRSEMNIKPNASIHVLVKNGQKSDQEKLEHYFPYLQQLAKIETLCPLAGPTPKAATAVYQQLTLLVPLEGLIDVAAEKARTEKTLKKLNAEWQKCTDKLNNPSYTEKAPAHIVEKDRGRAKELEATIEKLKHQLEQL